MEYNTKLNTNELIAKILQQNEQIKRLHQAILSLLEAETQGGVVIPDSMRRDLFKILGLESVGLMIDRLNTQKKDTERKLSLDTVKHLQIKDVQKRIGFVSLDSRECTYCMKLEKDLSVRHGGIGKLNINRCRDCDYKEKCGLLKVVKAQIVKAQFVEEQIVEEAKEDEADDEN